MIDRIKPTYFCALSREEKFQSWLARVSPFLHAELLNHLQKSAGCTSNREKMTQIYKELDNMRMKEELIKFLKTNYPLIIESVDEKKHSQSPFPDSSKIKVLTTLMGDVIFPNYYPHLLTFPHKIVFTGPSEELDAYAKMFIADKVSTDYIIVGNNVYIEYFKHKYQKEAEQVKPENRDIFKYRLRGSHA